MCTPKQSKTLGQSDAKAAMEALEFLVALLIIITLPNERGRQESRNGSKAEIAPEQSLTALPVEFGSYFKVGGMWIGKNFLFKK